MLTTKGKVKVNRFDSKDRTEIKFWIYRNYVLCNELSLFFYVGSQILITVLISRQVIGSHDINMYVLIFSTFLRVECIFVRYFVGIF